MQRINIETPTCSIIIYDAIEYSRVPIEVVLWPLGYLVVFGYVVELGVGIEK